MFITCLSKQHVVPPKKHTLVLHVNVGIQFAKYELQQMSEVVQFSEKTIVDVVSALLEEHLTPWQKLKEKAGTEECIAGQRLTNRARKCNTVFLHRHLKITCDYTAGHVAFTACHAEQSWKWTLVLLFVYRCTSKLADGVDSLKE